MKNEELKQWITVPVPGAVFTETGEFPQAVIEPVQLLPLAEKLRHDPAADFDHLFCLTAVDWVDFFYVVYHLASRRHRHTLVLKVKLPGRENPETDSVSHIWKTANFHEREIYDLFGIRFRGHPDLKRLFLDEGWKGHPLRKDYKDDVNMVEL